MQNRAGRAAKEVLVTVGNISNRDGSLQARKAGKFMQVFKSGPNSSIHLVYNI